MTEIAKSIIIATIILAISFIASIIIKLPPKPLPTTQEIQASAQAEQERLTLIHKNEMEYQEAKNKEPIRPLTEEQIDTQTISVPERIGLKFFLGI